MTAAALNSTVPAIVVFAACVLGPVRAVRAELTAIGFDTRVLWTTGGGTAVYGWQFRPHTDIQITSLGLYDSPGHETGWCVFDDGFLESHAIAVWDVASHADPLLSAIIPAGKEAPITDGFRFVGVTPISLSAERDYVIGAYYSGPLDMTVGSNNAGFVLQVSTEIEFAGYRSALAGGLMFPGTYTPGFQGLFGPNFTFNVVPEPSIGALCALATIIIRGPGRRHSDHRWKLGTGSF